MILEAEYLGLYTDSLFSLFIFSFPGRIKSKKQNPEVRVSMSSLKSWNSVWMEGSRSNTWPIVELTAVKAWAELLTSSSSSVGGAMIPAWFGYCLHFQPHLSLLFFTQVTAQMQVTLTAACCYLCSLSCLYTLLLFSHWVLSDSASPRTAGHQASLSFTISWSLLKSMPFELVILSNHPSHSLPSFSYFAFSLSQHLYILAHAVLFS